VQNAVSARELTDMQRHAPAATMAMAGRMLGQAQMNFARTAPLANCTITNVPGSAEPLYLCGARMTYFSAMLPLVDGMGLVIAVTSYGGQIIISPTSCRELMPDPAVFAQCLRDSFQELLALVAKPQQKTRKLRAARR
jgi:diacylglycerol O-acyltransferase / wax synthase